MERIWYSGGSIAASGTQKAENPIQLVRARTVTFTVRTTFNASATGDLRADVFFSPDGENWDTIVYTSFDIAVTAGGTVQRSVNVDPPEHGYLKMDLVNEDQTYAITNYKTWFSIQSNLPYPDWETLARGEITTKVEAD